MRRLHLRRLFALAAFGSMACQSPDEREAAPPASMPAPDAAPAPWYARGRTVDLTGDGRADSISLKASGERPDSLQIALSFIVDGEEKHREEWGSSYELALVDSAIRHGPRAEEIVRAKLDSVLGSVVVEPLDGPGVRLMAEDSAILAGVQPRPRERVSFSYGYETTTRVVWDAPRERFVRLWSCC